MLLSLLLYSAFISGLEIGGSYKLLVKVQCRVWLNGEIKNVIHRKVKAFDENSAISFEWTFRGRSL